MVVFNPHHHTNGSFFDEGRLGRKLLPCVLMAIVSAIGAGLVYACEKDNTDTGCTIFNFWEALFFVNTVHNTVGYGTVFPCTTGGKIVTVIYALVALPIFLIMLDNIGQIIAYLATKAWFAMKRTCCKCLHKKNGKKVASELIVVDGKVIMPIGVGFTLMIVWMLLAAGFFYAFEERFAYFDWFYFMFISMTTIGFGDIAPKKYEYTCIHFIFITVGLSLFSMLLNVVQDKLENISEVVAESIAKEYQEMLAADSSEMTADPEQAKKIISQKLRAQKGGIILEKLMGKKAKENLVNSYTQFANMKTIALQTDRNVQDFEVMCALSSGVSKEAQTIRSVPVPVQGRAAWQRR